MNYHYTSTGDTSAGKGSPEGSQSAPEQSIPDQLRQLTVERNKLLSSEYQLLEKGLSSSDPDTLIKANQYWQDVQNRISSEKKAVTFNPNDLLGKLEYKGRPTSLTYETLRRMARRTPVIDAIIKTRKNQVSAFSNPQRNKYEPGFIVRKKQKHFTEQEEKMKPADLKRAQVITDFLINGGNFENAWHGDTFETFLRKITEDSLTLDAATFEVIRDRSGVPIEYLATDGATYRIADSYDDDEYESKMRKQERGYYPSYVQVIEDKIYEEFYPWELCYGVRNFTTDIYKNGYGTSELEQLINVVTWMLYGDQYNGKFFTQGAAPKGIIKVAGNVNSSRLHEFRQNWQSMVAGVHNAWKVPVIESDKMEWIDLQKSNQDMQFSAWQEYLIKVSCSIFTIAPEEIGFDLGGSGGGGALFEGNNEQKIKYSRDKGLRPLLKSLQFWINKWIVNAIDPDYELEFVGLDLETEEAEVDLDIKKVSNFMGFKELRRKYNLPDELEEGDFILNPQYTQMIQAQQQAEMYGDMSNQVVEEEFGEGTAAEEEVEEGGAQEDESAEENPFLKGELAEGLDKILNDLKIQ